tara:strand:+ start:778 stop:2088 length:1311 start_codon:yes stop_codon:yes gene_type:complete
MVFGWGKKRDVIEERKEEIIIPSNKETTIQKIPEILQGITDLRQKTLVLEAKSFRNRMDSDRKTILSIAQELDTDDLKTDDMDPHLQILVNRGKKEVIETIQNELKSEFSQINSFDDVLAFQKKASKGVKKIGDMLGKHSRVIHIFAKKYAKKLKDDMEIFSNILKEANSLISNYNSNKELLNEIKALLRNYSKVKEDLSKQRWRISQLEKSLKDEKDKERNLNETINAMKSSTKYKEFQKTKSDIDSISDKEKFFIKKVDSEFFKISRPLNKYVYVSSLEKPLKKMIQVLATSPFQVLSLQNESSIKTILDSVLAGIDSGAVSVKDINKSKQAVNKIKEVLPDLLKEKNSFDEKRSVLNHKLNDFDNDKFIELGDNMQKTYDNMEDLDARIVDIQKNLITSKKSIFDIISKLELNLKQASSTSYKISMSENDLQK